MKGIRVCLSVRCIQTNYLWVGIYLTISIWRLTSFIHQFEKFCSFFVWWKCKIHSNLIRLSASVGKEMFKHSIDLRVKYSFLINNYQKTLYQIVSLDKIEFNIQELAIFLKQKKLCNIKILIDQHCIVHLQIIIWQRSVFIVGKNFFQKKENFKF